MERSAAKSNNHKVGGGEFPALVFYVGYFVFHNATLFDNQGT